jgi:hypothetical protein
MCYRYVVPARSTKAPRYGHMPYLVEFCVEAEGMRGPSGALVALALAIVYR